VIKKQKFGKCAACGIETELTREHVPPQNLFLSPRPTNTITTWTCAKCNKETELDDEYFRLFVTVGAEPETRAGQLWAEKVVGSTFTRSPALKNQLQIDLVKLRQRHKTQPLQTYDGEIVADDVVDQCIMLDASRIKRVAEKIVRCLHFHHHSTSLPQDLVFEFSVAPLGPPKLEQIIRDRKGLVGGENGEFIYWYQFNDQSRFSSEWVLLFYLKNCITVTTEQRQA
jgi:hypothetical protein